MLGFIIEPNKYLDQSIRAFYHSGYFGHRNHGNPDYIYQLKNDDGKNSTLWLNVAVQELEKILLVEMPQILQELPVNSLTVSVVPRAKAEKNYEPEQKRFKFAVSNLVNRLNNSFYDGTGYIIRHTNTKTTHLERYIQDYNNDGPKPYKGITTKTCHISNDVEGKDILLIDDIYTKTINIDEDAIQALFDNGANSVAFYAIGRTVRKGN